MEAIIELKSIGEVRIVEGVFSLQLKDDYRNALIGVQGFSHLNVLWWAHYLDQPEMRAVLTSEKPYKKGPQTLGIFATRSPLRPNPICLSVVSVMQIDPEQGKILIPYIDAEDRSPILDIKPYHPSTDRVREALVPDWCRHWPESLEDSAIFDWEAEFENAS